jgi:Tol biopolymer transport system component
MRKILVSSLVLTLTAVWLIACGSSSKPKVLPQTTVFAFLQEAPSAGNYMFSPVRGTFSTIGGNTTFTATTVVDTSTNKPVIGDFGSIILSADSKKATFDLYGGLDGTSNQWDIWVANADGTGNAVQISKDGYEAAFPQFSPDGTKVVYASNRPIPGNESSYQWQIVVANASGTGTAQVLPIPAGMQYQMHPTFSPDGTKLAMIGGGYTSGTSGVPFYGILLTNADGTNAQVLSNALYSDTCYFCYDELPSFTSDGTKIAFSRDNEDQTPEVEDIYIMNADGTGITKLTDSVGINNDPLVLSISAVGERILFSSNRDNVNGGNGGYDLYSIKTDGTGLTRLTNNTLYDAFSQWWYYIEDPAAAQHMNRVSREHMPFRGHGATHRVNW